MAEQRTDQHILQAHMEAVMEHLTATLNQSRSNKTRMLLVKSMYWLHELDSIYWLKEIEAIDWMQGIVDTIEEDARG